MGCYRIRTGDLNPIQGSDIVSLGIEVAGLVGTSGGRLGGSSGDTPSISCSGGQIDPLGAVTCGHLDDLTRFGRVGDHIDDEFGDLIRCENAV